MGNGSREGVLEARLLPLQIKGFPQHPIWGWGVQFALVPKVRPVILNSQKGRNQLTHVEAHESASDSWPSR
jgi:hypothetical protein